MGKSPKVAYVVFKGRSPGVYRSWAECEAQVSGFPGNRQCGYYSVSEAEEAWKEHLESEKFLGNASARKNTAPSSSPHVSSSQDSQERLPTDGERHEDPLGRTYYKDQSSQSISWNPPPANKTAKTQQKQQDVASDYSYKPIPKRSRPAEYIVIDDKDEPKPRKRVKGDGSIQEIFEPGQLDVSEPIEEIFKEGESVVLTADQEAVVSMALQKHNIFLTGAGGCGKTVTLKHLLARFKARGIKCQVVAPTGIAALPLGGKTAYSYLGWKPDSMRLSLEKLLDAPKTYVKKAVRSTAVLIIEEISMVENLFLERMNLVMQEIMDNRRPFGGKQVIFLGDFHQLPPVKPFETCINCGLLLSREPPFKCEQCPNISFNEGDKWAFKSDVWKRLKLKNVQLRQIHRQKDERFQDILNKIRYGVRLTDEEWAELEAKRPLPRGACAVRLMSLRMHVNEVNRKELAALKFTAKQWEAEDSYYMVHSEQNGQTPWEHEQPLKSHRFSERVTLKVGAKVVLLTNLDFQAGLVNGSQGEVIGFEKRDNPDNSTAMYFTVENEDRTKPALLKAFVAPIVRFSNGIAMAIDPIDSTSQHGTNQAPYRATRIQIPLSLAWALTIHKSQGMTLKFVEVSKKDLFEPGQLYVALSRATDLDGLTVSGFSREQLPVDDDVLQFYENTEWENLGLWSFTIGA